MLDGLLGELHRFHHLADESICHQYNRVAIAVGQFEGQRGQIRHLLHGIGRKHDGAVVAVAAALHHLVIVALLGCNVAQPRAAAGNVGDHAGQFRAGHVTDAFLHQADSRAAGRGHRPHASRRCTVEHVYSRYFAFGLQVDTACMRHIPGRSFRDLACRGDGVSIKGTAS